MLSFVQAGKKQLVKGKVAMVFAVIEALDTQGSDASVTLRDKSGRWRLDGYGKCPTFSNTLFHIFCLKF